MDRADDFAERAVDLAGVTLAGEGLGLSSTASRSCFFGVGFGFLRASACALRLAAARCSFFLSSASIFFRRASSSSRALSFSSLRRFCSSFRRAASSRLARVVRSLSSWTLTRAASRRARSFARCSSTRRFRSASLAAISSRLRCASAFEVNATVSCPSTSRVLRLRSKSSFHSRCSSRRFCASRLRTDRSLSAAAALLGVTSHPPPAALRSGDLDAITRPSADSESRAPISARAFSNLRCGTFLSGFFRFAMSSGSNSSRSRGQLTPSSASWSEMSSMSTPKELSHSSRSSGVGVEADAAAWLSICSWSRLVSSRRPAIACSAFSILALTAFVPRSACSESAFSSSSLSALRCASVMPTFSLSCSISADDASRLAWSASPCSWKLPPFLPPFFPAPVRRVPFTCLTFFRWIFWWYSCSQLRGMLRRAQAIVYAASVSTQLAAGPAVHRDKTRAQGGVFITRRYYGREGARC